MWGVGPVLDSLQVWGRFPEAQKFAKHLVARARKANDDALQLAEALLLLDDVMTASPGGFTSMVRRKT